MTPGITTRRAGQRPRWRGLVLLLGIAALSSCALTPRKPPPPELINSAVPEGFAPDIRLLSVDQDRFASDMPSLLSGLHKATGGGPLDILVLSGGGAGGAFGAGALVGLGKTHALPSFQIVTGVSAGALIAPFAFLGPAWDPQLVKIFDGGAIERLQRPHALGLIGRTLFPRAAGAGDALAVLVDQNITDAMIDAVARKAARGNKLIVATTDLDDEETMLWDMGAIAMHGGPAAHALFRKVLVASASVPGVFPPVLIRVHEGTKVYDEMHVDGDVTTSLFAAPLIAHILPAMRSGFGGANMYVIVNGHLAAQPHETPVNTLRILADSLSAELTYKTRDALSLVLDLAHQDGMRFHLTALPAGYPSGNFLDFNRGHLSRLFEYGEGCASRGLLWTNADQALHRDVYGRAGKVSTATACPAIAMGVPH
ncbi:MAG: patatin-like phospholipase family protein [Proteobacteria bacterium]|nr:patatin-like phospholipase family protein [Pseudomonadota bacterium]